MSDQKSIWKKEIKLRKQPANAAAETPASPPEQRSGSIWKKEIGFRKGSATAKQNGHERGDAGQEASFAKASKKELRMRRSPFRRSRPVLETPADSEAPLCRAGASVLEESATGDASHCRSRRRASAQADAVEPWRPTEAEGSELRRHAEPDEVETSPRASTSPAVTSSPVAAVGSELPARHDLEDNGVRNRRRSFRHTHRRS